MWPSLVSRSTGDLQVALQLVGEASSPVKRDSGGGHIIIILKAQAHLDVALLGLLGDVALVERLLGVDRVGGRHGVPLVPAGVGVGLQQSSGRVLVALVVDLRL